LEPGWLTVVEGDHAGEQASPYASRASAFPDHPVGDTEFEELLQTLKGQD
jgi:hypothetical protein